MTDYRVNIVIELMHSQMSRRLSISYLATTIHASPTLLRCLFKRGTGLSPMQYLKGLRLEKARALLCTQHSSVKEIMAAVGYNDASHFVRDFESVYGLSPRRYRLAYHRSSEVA